MSITVRTNDPAQLWQDIQDGINNVGAINIKTWEISSHGNLTHKSPQYHKKAYLKAYVGHKVIEFQVIKPSSNSPPLASDIVYYYYGHISYMLLEHFKNSINSITLD